MLNLVYLAAIAFMPFPTALVGKYEQLRHHRHHLRHRRSAAASLLDAAMYARAHHQQLFRQAGPPTCSATG